MYNKLFTKILDSSVWLENDQTRLVWFTLLASMDEDGFAQFASSANLAHRARVTREQCEQSVSILEAPDLDSSDPAHEGRRIERVPGGWMVLNSKKYRELAKREIARAQTRQRVRDFRMRKNGEEEAIPSAITHTKGNDFDTEGNADVTQSKNDLPEWVPVDAWESYLEMRKKIRANMTERAKALALGKLESLKKDGNNPKQVLEQSVMNSWKGLFPLGGMYAAKPNTIRY